ncbi:MAG: S-layer homology domain-containing protein [Clostridia bacterium]|nr:S-layer homology domain-containing protein [Clostridia bacterium]
MRKTLAIILCLSMIFSAISCFAAVDSGYKTVLETVKSRIPDTDKFDDFSANQSINNGIKTYSFSWHNSDTDEMLGIEVLENGIITRLNFSSKADVVNEKAMSDISRDEALKKAISAFEKINPDIKDKVVIEHSTENKKLWETRQNFLISRIENGVKVAGDTGYIEMDINADNILWFYIKWSNYDEFEALKNSISLEDAKKIYSEKLGIELVYKTKFEKGEKVPYLVYTPKENINMYVAFDGSIIKCNPYADYRTGGGGATKNMAMMQDSAAEFSKAELAEFEKLDGMLSQERVEEIVLSQDIFAIKGFKLEQISLTRDYYEKDKYIYSLRYKSDKLTASVSVDALTGEILSFSKYSNSESELKVSENDAQNTLKQSVIALCKNNFEEYRLVKSDGCAVEYHRIVNGIRFPGDSITASVNEFTGELESYSKTYSNVDFPSKENVISPNMILKSAFEMFSYNLKYVPSYNEKSGKTDIKLVFAFENDSFDIDPFTGENYLKGDSVIEYEDIENHYAKEYIKELAAYGIGLGNKTFLPDKEITQKEYISLLVKVFYRYFTVYSDLDEEIEENYRIAVREGIIKQEEINYDALVARENAAKYLACALGYKDIAKAESIFNCPFVDVTKNKGNITILYGLNIVNGDENGNFNPYENISRADTMIMLYKCLSK